MGDQRPVERPDLKWPATYTVNRSSFTIVRATTTRSWWDRAQRGTTLTIGLLNNDGLATEYQFAGKSIVVCADGGLGPRRVQQHRARRDRGLRVWRTRATATARPDAVDNCPTVYNPSHLTATGTDWGMPATDRDGDNVLNGVDCAPDARGHRRFPARRPPTIRSEQANDALERGDSGHVYDVPRLGCPRVTFAQPAAHLGVLTERPRRTRRVPHPARSSTTSSRDATRAVRKPGSGGFGQRPQLLACPANPDGQRRRRSTRRR